MIGGSKAPFTWADFLPLMIGDWCSFTFIFNAQLSLRHHSLSAAHLLYIAADVLPKRMIFMYALHLCLVADRCCVYIRQWSGMNVHRDVRSHDHCKRALIYPKHIKEINRNNVLLLLLKAFEALLTTKVSKLKLLLGLGYTVTKIQAQIATKSHLQWNFNYSLWNNC